MHLSSEGPILAGFLLAGIRMAAPLVAAALGETVSEHSGTVNLGTEGVMLIGATAGFSGVFCLESLGWSPPAAFVAGTIFAVLAGMICGIVLTGVMLALRAHQIVSGLAFSILALGVTDLAFRRMAGYAAVQPTVDTRPAIAYATYALIPIVWLLLLRTGWGLNLRACGDNPLEAETQGVRVIWTRTLALLCGCALAAFGGMVLAVGCVGTLSYNMVAGRGYIAVAIVYFGNWRPAAVLWTALLFGLADAAQMRLQTVLDVPYQFLSSLPYLLTVLTLAGMASRSRQPAALMQPYDREQSAVS
jgi:simple sugar transport system permease protein